MAHKVIKKLKPIKKPEDFLQQISYGAKSNQKIEAFKKNPKISYGTQYNLKKKKAMEKIKFLILHRVIKNLKHF